MASRYALHEFKTNDGAVYFFTTHGVHSLWSSQVCVFNFQRDLVAISDQVQTITKTAESLLETFPDAQDHIHSKHEEMVSAWQSLLSKAKLRKDRLHQAESVQLYFDDYRGLWYG